MLRKSGEPNKTESAINNNLAEAIQAKAVLHSFRNLHSACSRYNLINKNPQPFEPDATENSSEDEGAERRLQRETLMDKVSCPVKFKIIQKVFREKSEARKESILKRPILKLVKQKTKVEDPWEKEATLMPDGSIKCKSGLEKLVLTKKEQENYNRKVRINTKLKTFRQKAYYDLEGRKEKLQKYLLLNDFLDYAKFPDEDGDLSSSTHH